MKYGSPPQASPAARPPWLAGLLKRALRMVILGLVLTMFYSWAVPRFHPRAGPAGFAYGMLHGAIMPMALPALAAGQDVLIYAERNTGRTYKLGYTIGINLCGLVVFGTAFWTPRRKEEKIAGP
jgi:Mg/Co/Ni transporter MgtE